MKRKLRFVLFVCTLATADTSLPQSDYSDQLSPEQKAQLPVVYQKMLQRGEVPKGGACVVFVPFMCPSEDAFEEALLFMVKACGAAQRGNAHVVIVRYPSERPGGELWSKWVQQLEKQTQEYVSSGTVKMINLFPEAKYVTNATPWGYLFRDGKPIDDNDLITWAAHPGPILNELARARDSSADAGAPPESAGRKAFQEKIKDPDQQVKLVSFHKTNGSQREANGATSYELEYVAEVEFLKDCWWSDKGDEFLISGIPETQEDKQFRQLFKHADWQMAKKGQRRTIHGTFQFIATGNDWKLNDEE